MPALDPVEIGCHPQNCDMKLISIEKAVSYDIKPCENEEHMENSQYFLEIHESCKGSPNLVYKSLSEFRNYFTEMCFKKLFLTHIHDEDGIFNYDTVHNYEYDEICSILTGHTRPDEIKDKFLLNELMKNSTQNLSNNEIFKMKYTPKYHEENIYENYEVMIGFENLYTTSIEEVYLDTFISMLIDLVGTFGFWLGFSFITSFDFLYFMFNLGRNALIDCFSCGGGNKVEGEEK